MPHVHTLPLLLFVLFDIAYVIFCVYLYVRLLLSVRNRPKQETPTAKINFEKLSIVAITFFSLYIMSKWAILQIVQGCSTVAFWNPTCYDLNHLSRAWVAICLLVSLNAIAYGMIHDLQAQNKKLRDDKKR